MKKILFFILLSSFVFGQNIGDYQAVASGNWSGNNVWQVFNGASWVTISNSTTGVTIGATTYYYPGNPASSSSVTINPGVAVTSNVTSASTGNLTVKGNLILGGNLSLATTQSIILDGGVLSFGGNYNLSLPADASVSMVNGGSVATDSPCNANKTITIGSYVYSSCSGGGALASFAQLNTAKGSINSLPVVSPASIIVNGSVNLSGGFSGYTGGNPVSYSWSVVSAPAGYTFSSTVQNPGSQTLSLAGTYVYRLRVSFVSGGVTYANFTDATVVVNSNCNIVKNGDFSTTTLNTGANNWTVTGDSTGGETYSFVSATNSAYSNALRISYNNFGNGANPQYRVLQSAPINLNAGSYSFKVDMAQASNTGNGVALQWVVWDVKNNSIVQTLGSYRTSNVATSVATYGGYTAISNISTAVTTSALTNYSATLNIPSNGVYVLELVWIPLSGSTPTNFGATLADDVLIDNVTVSRCINPQDDAYTAAAGTTTASVFNNDTVNGLAATSSNVTLSAVTLPPGFTLNPDGTIKVKSTTVSGTYQVTYQICDNLNTASCAMAVATITVSTTCATIPATSYTINLPTAATNPSDTYTSDRTVPLNVNYTVSSGTLTSNIKVTKNIGTTGYGDSPTAPAAALAFNRDAPAPALPTLTPAGYYPQGGVAATNKSIRIQGVADTNKTGGDVLDFTLNATTAPTGYLPQITLTAFVKDNGGLFGNSESAELTISFTVPNGNVASYADATTAYTSSDYKNGVPNGFDLNNKAIEGLVDKGTYTSESKFIVYDVPNASAPWFVKFPPGATNIRVINKTLNGGTSSTAGTDNAYPVAGYKGGVTNPGESFNEWLSFTVDFVPICVCYKPATTTGTALPTTHGITSLGRAGVNSDDPTLNNNWPLVRNGAWTALESKTKGFVINRIDGIPVDGATPGQVPTTVIANPVKGMMIYDIINKCLKTYNGTQWGCINTQTCPSTN